MPDYWLDSDVFIESKKRWYRFATAPGFWSFIDQKVAERLICASSRVYSELVDSADDDLAAWARDRKGLPFFVDPDEAVQRALGTIVDYVKTTYPGTKATDDFLAGADPWIIAHAQTHGGTVITLETRVSPGTRKAKIPDVCDHFGVGCDSLFEMVERLGMILR